MCCREPRTLHEPGLFGREADHFRDLAALGGRVLRPRERMQNAPGEH